MRDIIIKVYKLNELSEDAKNRAICDHINFECEIMDENSPYYDCAIKMDKMQTPWFLAQVIYEEHLESIIETIEINEYEFFESGELIPVKYHQTNEN